MWAARYRAVDLRVTLDLERLHEVRQRRVGVA
jgi:hypothetical protein